MGGFAVLLLLVIAVFAVILVFWTLATYNALVRQRNDVETAWGQVETETQRRLDLITPLVDVVKGYASHERSTLEAVTQARAAAVSQDPLASADEVMDPLSQALGRLLALQEAYPDLKADSSFLNLQAQLVEVERSINLARRVYNESVRLFNTRQQQFPAVLVAGRLGFRPGEQFRARPAAAEPPPTGFTPSDH